VSAVSELVYDALYACQAAGEAESISADDAAVVLRRLIRLLDSWSNVKAMCFANTTDSTTTAAGTASYATTLFTTLGRPIAIDAAYVRQSGTDFGLDIITAEQWTVIPYKAARGMPQVLWYDSAYPTGTVNLYPTPDAAYTLYVQARKPLTSALTLATSISLPPGYEKAIVDTLAVDIAPTFERPVTEAMMVASRAAEYVLRTTNYEGLLLDPGYGTTPARSYIISDES
jgi:hypothetical protein